MKHARARELLSPYLERDLDGSDRLEMEAHVARCAECAAELDEMRETVLLLRGLPKLDPSPYLATRVMARIADGEGEPRGLQRLLRGRWATPLAASLAAAVAALAVVSFETAPGTPGAEATQVAQRTPARPPIGGALPVGTPRLDAASAVPRVVPVALGVSPAAVQALLRGAGHPHSSELAEHFQRPHDAVVVSWSPQR